MFAYLKRVRGTPEPGDLHSSKRARASPPAEERDVIPQATIWETNRHIPGPQTESDDLKAQNGDLVTVARPSTEDRKASVGSEGLKKKASSQGPDKEEDNLLADLRSLEKETVDLPTTSSNGASTNDAVSRSPAAAAATARHVHFSGDNDYLELAHDDQGPSSETMKGSTLRAATSAHTNIVKNQSEEEHSAEDSDDDDDAPEDMSSSTAARQVQAREAGAARAIKDQADAAKRKRQERTQRLQAQADSKPRKDIHQKPRTAPKHKDQKSDDGSMEIDLLPDSVLQDDTPARAPSPTINDSRDGKDRWTDGLTYTRPEAAKRIRFKEDEPVPDVRVGGLKVRVLPKINTLLAPKAEPQGRRMRQSMLKGSSRSGRQRRAVNAGFLRV